ncbi:N-substituted formamide deformylase precursor [Microbacterium oxydans]|uniref:N-substituted formamide deformylase n=1 Tax=Microbacterium oxydans TaxID=82380 RepID=A0A0F0KHI8_9MICO|nr:amidohydrolase [Microbacterium oxydans]KJL20357.1 N-substituted formamide deformylase precursor [Microbacterium oxydans]
MARELIFHGGPVFTGSGAPLEQHAVIVREGRIAAVVPEHELDDAASDDAQRIDLGGALLSPGFQDAHIHPVGGGIELLQCNLSESTSAADAARLVRAYADANPQEEWILGGGWSMDHFPGGNPPRDLLDEAAGGRPVLLQSRDHHSTWASTAAIERAGITADTPDPADGRIVREADGFPAGTFHEGAGDLFAHVRPTTSDELAYQGLLRAQQELIALGITGWQDAMVAANVAGISDPLAAYERALQEGTLAVHVVGAQWWVRDGGIEQVERMVERRERAAESRPDRRLDLGTTKIMVDGVAENQTAAMLTPYRDETGHDTCNHGLSFIEPAKLRDYVVALDAAGQQVHMHALGDRAVREALDALDVAHEANGATDGRHHLAHLQIVAEADIPRFADLGAIANLQALWATHEDQLDELTLPFLQEGQEARQYPFGDFARAGVRFAAGSDWPVSSADPIAAIHIAVNRAYPGSTREPLGGHHQRLDLETALAAYTSGSAYVNRRDDDTGRIREGYLANLVVLDPNPFDVDEADIHRTRVTSTWIEGKPVYTAAAASRAAHPAPTRKES